MKKIIAPLILIVGLLFNNAYAQEGAYLNVYGAYALPMASTVDYYNSLVTAEDSVDAGFGGQSGEVSYYDVTIVTVPDEDGFPITTSTVNNVKINLGKGLNFGVAFGYMFDDHFGAELGVGYFLGSKSKFTQESINEMNPADIITTTLDGEIYARQIRINPSFIVSTDYADFVPYAKFGVVLGVGTKITEMYNDQKYTVDTETVEQTYESKGGIAFGLNASIGALYKLNKKTGIFLDLTGVTMSYSPKTRTLTEYKLNGEVLDIDALFSYNSIEIEYSDEIESGDNDDKTNSTLELSRKYPFSSFGFNIGIRFSF